MTAATACPLGAIREAPAARAMLRALMRRRGRSGRAIGIPLADDLVDRQFSLLDAQAWDASTSMLHDRLTGHRMELEAIQGTVIRLGRAHGIPTPATDAAYAIIEPWAIRNERPEGERQAIG